MKKRVHDRTHCLSADFTPTALLVKTGMVLLRNQTQIRFFYLIGQLFPFYYMPKIWNLIIMVRLANWEDLVENLGE